MLTQNHSNTFDAYASQDGFSTKQSIVLSLVTILFALAMPLNMVMLPMSEFISWIVCLAFGILVVISTRKFSTVVILSLALTFFASYTGSAASVALVVGTISACGIYSALAAELRKGYISLLAIIPIVAFASTYALTSEIILAIFALAPFLPSLAMGITLRRGASRVGTIAAFAAVAAIEIGGVALLHIYTQNGSLSLEIIGEAAEYFKSITKETLTIAIETAGQVAITEDIALMVDTTAIEMTNLLVGLVSVVIITIGFFAQKIQHAVFEKLEIENRQNMSGAPITASVAAAIVYGVAYICSFTSGASNSPSFFAVAAGNISLMLLPLLLCVGFAFLSELPRKIGFLALVVWLAIFGGAFLLSSSVIDIIALVGAFHTLLVNIDLWAEEHYSKGEDQ